MTDDEILAAAKRINARRAAEEKLASLDTGRDLMIRWTRPGVHSESNVSVPVSPAQIQHLVRAHFEAIIDRNRTEGGANG